MKLFFLLSLLFLGLNSTYANDSTKLNKVVFSPAIGYNLVGIISGPLGQLSVSRFIFPKISIGLNAQVIKYWDKPMVPLTLELMRRRQDALRTSFIAVAQGGALLWNRSANVKVFSGQDAREKHSGKYTWGAGAGVQFKSKRQSAIYTMAKFHLYQLRHQVSIIGEDKPYYVDNDYSGTIQVVLGLNFF